MQQATWGYHPGVQPGGGGERLRGVEGCDMIIAFDLTTPSLCHVARQ